MGWRFICIVLSPNLGERSSSFNSISAVRDGRPEELGTTACCQLAQSERVQLEHLEQVAHSLGWTIDSGAQPNCLQTLAAEWGSCPLSISLSLYEDLISPRLSYLSLGIRPWDCSPVFFTTLSLTTFIKKLAPPLLSPVDSLLNLVMDGTLVVGKGAGVWEQFQL